MRGGRDLEALDDLITPRDTCAMERAALSLYQTSQHDKEQNEDVVATHLAINEEKRQILFPCATCM